MIPALHVAALEHNAKVVSLIMNKGALLTIKYGFIYSNIKTPLLNLTKVSNLLRKNTLFQKQQQ